MRPSAPRRRRTVLDLRSYTTRLLLSYALSLGVLVLLVNLSVSSPPVSPWLLHTNPDRIQLSQVQELSDDEPGADETGPANGAQVREEAPPQTRQASPSTSPSPAPAGAPQEDTRSPRARPNLESITTITETSAAELIGGIQSYYMRIRYPEPARKKGIQGRLMLRFTVTSNGRPRDIRVSRSLHPLLDTAAVRALRSVRFRPATQNGLPVSMPTKLPVRFRLLPDSTRLRTAGGPSPSQSTDAPNE